jgi:hypothetical protein
MATFGVLAEAGWAIGEKGWVWIVEKGSGVG